MEAGATVAIGDLDERQLDEDVDELGTNAIGLVVDVRDALSFSSFLDATESAWGPLDVLVNNAGVLRMGPLAEATAADIALQLDVNLGGVVTGTRLALDRFLPRRRGHIVNMASSAAMVATRNGAIYSATKHAVLGLTRAVRGELRGSGVRTTVVMPGVVRTEMTQDFGHAIGVRVIEPEAVADGVVAAVRHGHAEVCVPREIAVQGRLLSALPSAAADFLKRATRADEVMH